MNNYSTIAVRWMMVKLTSRLTLKIWASMFQKLEWSEDKFLVRLTLVEKSKCSINDWLTQQSMVDELTWSTINDWLGQWSKNGLINGLVGPWETWVGLHIIMEHLTYYKYVSLSLFLVREEDRKKWSF